MAPRPEDPASPPPHPPLPSRRPAPRSGVAAPPARPGDVTTTSCQSAGSPPPPGAHSCHTPRRGRGGEEDGTESAASAPPTAELAGAGSPPRPRRRGPGEARAAPAGGAPGAAPEADRPSPPPLPPPGKGPVTGPGNLGALGGGGRAAAHALPFCARDAARTRRREARPGPSAPARRPRAPGGGGRAPPGGGGGGAKGGGEGGGRVEGLVKPASRPPLPRRRRVPSSPSPVPAACAGSRSRRFLLPQARARAAANGNGRGGGVRAHRPGATRRCASLRPAPPGPAPPARTHAHAPPSTRARARTPPLPAPPYGQSARPGAGAAGKGRYISPGAIYAARVGLLRLRSGGAPRRRLGSAAPGADPAASCGARERVGRCVRFLCLSSSRVSCGARFGALPVGQPLLLGTSLLGTGPQPAPGHPGLTRPGGGKAAVVVEGCGIRAAHLPPGLSDEPVGAGSWFPVSSSRAGKLCCWQKPSRGGGSRGAGR